MLAVIIGLLLLIYVLLWLPPVQQKALDVALNVVMQKTNTHMSVGNIKFRPFNHLELSDVYVEDYKGDTLLYAQKLSAGIAATQLLRNKLHLTSVELSDFTINVNKQDTVSPFNFQFLIDSFASADTAVLEPGTSPMEILVDNINLHQGRIAYDVFSEAKQNGFDANHIHISDFLLEADFRFLAADDFGAALRSFSFHESSGLTLANLKADFAATKNNLQLTDFVLQLPASELRIDNASADYTGATMAQLADEAAYNAFLTKLTLYPPDLQAFLPSLGKLTDSLNLTATMQGKLPAINVQKLQLDYGNGITLETQAELKNYKEWDSSSFNILVSRLLIDPAKLSEIMQAFSTEASTDVLQPIANDNISIIASAEGALPDFRIRLNADAQTGTLALNGTGGYHSKTGQNKFDVSLDANSFNLRRLLNNKSLGVVDLKMDAKGGTNAQGNLLANLDLLVSRFDFNGYSYKDVQAKVNYNIDSVYLLADVNDPNVPLHINGVLALPDKKPAHALVYAEAKHVKLERLNLLPEEYKGADLFVVFKADVTDFDIDKMQAMLEIDSLQFRTEKIFIEQGPIIAQLHSGEGREKQITLKSDLLNANVDGHFSFTSLAESFTHTLSTYLPAFIPPQKENKKKEYTDEFEFSLNIGNTEKLSETLSLPVTVVDTATVKGNYNSATDKLAVDVLFPQLKVNDMLLANTSVKLISDTLLNKLVLQADTKKLDEGVDTLNLQAKVEAFVDSITLAVQFSNDSGAIAMKGDIALNAFIQPVKGQSMPDMTIYLQPGSVQANHQQFQLKPATIWLTPDRYEVKDFEIVNPQGGSLYINGVASAHESDSVQVALSQFRLSTIMDMLEINSFDLQGEADGKIILRQVLSDYPMLFTDGFFIKDIAINNKQIGTLDLCSERGNDSIKGFLLSALLHQPDSVVSKITGQISPANDYMSVTADLRSIQLDWLQPFTNEFLFGLSGSIGTQLKAEGSLSSPVIDGFVYMNDANIGVKMTNVQYRLTDTIQITPEKVLLNNFRILDDDKRQAVIQGSIGHKNFSDLAFDVHLKMDNFLLLNNPAHTDSLFYGTLKMSGQVDVTGTDKGMLVKAAIQNADGSTVLVRLPESASQAQEYNSITYINTGCDDEICDDENMGNNIELPSATMPIKLQMNLTVTPGLTVGAVINPSTKDIASVSGQGNIDFTYDMEKSTMSLLGDYTIQKGQATLSLKNITRKKFTIREGGKVTFKGDPMATAFNVTAVYGLRADLVTLDESFSTDPYLTSTRIPVNCLITVLGDINKMELGYAIELPTVDNSVQRKADGLMYTNEIRIKEIAYLLAFGSFYAPEGSETNRVSGSSMWTSILSSSITNQLNNLLAGVLHENWSIGTDLHNDDATGDMEVDVNVSTRLMNNRLTINTNLGYRNSTYSDDSFTGDFSVEYKLTRTGEWVLKAYNVTNQQYYEQAPTTQGVGVVYKRQGKTFKDLFKKIKKVKKQ